MILIIAEKSSVGHDIAAVVGAETARTGYLEGNGYLVSWCVGHLVDSAPPETYDPAFKKWSLNLLPILPEKFQFQVADSTKRQFEKLKWLMERSDVESLVCATDAGREGENIFRLVYQAAGCKKPWKRLWTSSLEPTAIRTALSQMQDGHAYDNLGDAALCRQEADWLYGINLTRLYSCLYETKLPTGRVQSPTLSLIVQRQEQIDHFQPTPYFVVTCRLADCLDVQHRFEEEADAIAFIAADHKQAVISKVTTERKQIAPPRLYDLTSLQQEANRLFGYSANQTLADMQVLYEAKLATYPRTDSRYITDDMEASVRKMTVGFQNSGLLPQTAEQMDFHRLVNSNKVNDHPALMPTASLTRERLETLPSSQRNLLTLLLYRLLEATAPAHQYYTVTVEADIDGVDFTCQAKTPLAQGWKAWRSACIKAVGETEKEKSDSSESAISTDLTGFTEGARFPVTDTKQEKKLTKPPAPYTEASLLSAMETAGRSVTDTALRDAMRGKGLGTAATRANIIESLVTNGYIRREKRNLIPTEKAKTFMTVLTDRLKDPIMTAEWEAKLKDIEDGHGDPDLFLQEIKAFLGGYVNEAVRSHKDHPELYKNVFSTSDRTNRALVGKCPLCGGDVLIYPASYSCSNFKKTGCKFTIWKNFSGKELSASVVKGLLQNGVTRELKGFYSKKTGKSFDAALELHQDGSIGFVFGKKEAKKK